MARRRTVSGRSAAILESIHVMLEGFPSVRETVVLTLVRSLGTGDRRGRFGQGLPALPGIAILFGGEPAKLEAESDAIAFADGGVEAFLSRLEVMVLRVLVCLRETPVATEPDAEHGAGDMRGLEAGLDGTGLADALEEDFLSDPGLQGRLDGAGGLGGLRCGLDSWRCLLGHGWAPSHECD